MHLCFIHIFKYSYYHEEAGPISDTSENNNNKLKCAILAYSIHTFLTLLYIMTIITETENNEDQLWWEVKRRNNIPGGRRLRCGKFNVNWELSKK